MAIGELLTAASFVTKVGTAVGGYRAQVANDRARIETAQKQAGINNAQALLTFQTINDQELLELQALGFDKFEISRATRAAEASAKTAGASLGGAIASQSFGQFLTDIRREGATARFRRNLNFGTKVRNLDIERKNVRLNTIGLNNAAFAGTTPRASSTALGLKLTGLALQGINTFGKTTDVETGKRAFKGTN